MKEGGGGGGGEGRKRLQANPRFPAMFFHAGNSSLVFFLGMLNSLG